MKVIQFVTVRDPNPKALVSVPTATTGCMTQAAGVCQTAETTVHLPTPAILEVVVQATLLIVLITMPPEHLPAPMATKAQVHTHPILLILHHHIGE